MADDVTYEEHLEWCKKRALEYLETGDIVGAFSSMASDLSKHPETGGHPALELGMMLLVAGQLDSLRKMREFIEGFR